MTKKDYILLSTFMRHWVRPVVDRAIYAKIALNLGKELMSTNPSFDLDRFLSSCEVQ